MPLCAIVLTLFQFVEVNTTTKNVGGADNLHGGSERPGDTAVNRGFGGGIAFDNHRGSGFSVQRVNESDNAVYPGLVNIKKCCPWGTFFDTETLVCTETSSSRYAGDGKTAGIVKMEKDFLRSHVRNYEDVRYYRFWNEIPPCSDSMVFTSQVTTQFTFDNGRPKLEGREISGQYCIDGREGKGTVLLMCRKPEEVCGKSKPCIRKCKSYGDFFGMEDEGLLDLPSMAVEFYNLKTLKVDGLISISSFGLYFGNECGGRGRQKLSPEEVPDDVYYLGTDGRLYVPNPDQQYYTNEEFCIEYVKAENLSEVSAFLCSPEPPSPLKFYLLAACFLISCVFLLATFLVYLFSPRSQNLYGKSLMCYVASLFSAYISLAVIQLTTEDMDTNGCIAAGTACALFI